MIQKITFLFLLAAVVFSQGEPAAKITVPDVVEEKAEIVADKAQKIVQAIKEEIADVAVVGENNEVTQEQEAVPVTIHNLSPEGLKLLDKLNEYHDKALVLEAQTDPKSLKELTKVHRKMITLQHTLEEMGLNVHQALSDWNNFQVEKQKVQEEKELFNYFNQVADEAWYAEHPKEVEDKQLFGTEKVKAKIEKLKTKIQREEFKLAFLEERLSNPEKYLRGTYIFRFAPSATEESIDALYATLAEKSIEVLHKYSIGQAFRGFSAELSDADLGFILENEIIISFEAEGTATVLAKTSSKYVAIISELDSTCTGTVCDSKTINQ